MNNKFNKILDFEREKAKKGLEKAAKTAKATRIFMQKEKNFNKYRINTRNNKFSKVHIYNEQR